MKKKYLSYPYVVWLVIFITVPLLLVIYFAFTKDGAFTFDNFAKFFQPVYLKVFWRSLKLAFFSTVGCLVIGYPVAAILASREFVRKKALLLLCVLPMWMNMLLRTYAWMTILEKNGVLNTILGFLGLGPYQFLYTSGAVIVGMIYNFLPFMILPIYSSLLKIDRSVIEAAEDLGANSPKVFRKIILPLSMPGVISGVVMVFMPALSTFLISRLLGGGQFTLMGNLVEQQFLTVMDWNFGSALSVIMMILILLSMAFMGKSGKEGAVSLL